MGSLSAKNSSEKFSRLGTFKTFAWMSKNSASRQWLVGPGVSDSSESDIARLAAIMTHDALALWVIT
jgi:hypothetical protein